MSVQLLDRKNGGNVPGIHLTVRNIGGHDTTTYLVEAVLPFNDSDPVANTLLGFGGQLIPLGEQTQIYVVPIAAVRVDAFGLVPLG
ncbi:hypothetical protein KC660_02085 [Candidatus Dojkabacteria bacterium]|uniref:Uncharacterized protein n=1 Tax=Candidatus Dojkabacteria bacterium TaxID=2099670 RepID=A0A955L3G2_9BACT|nr:hypothetical protein [Candidatus Dojkabacteria bacterium]